ncbi:hypothetical protein CRYUN_Cryun01aG0232200 [Craigia yunnanensis]
MLMGHADGLSELRSSKDQLLAGPEEAEDCFQLDSSEQMLYTASFEELARNNLQYDTIIWVSRPSFIPFWGIITIEKHVPLSKVIDIIIEQGWLQSVYGIYTFRVESIAHGKAAPVDELQVQGVANPALLKKVIVREDAKAIQYAGKSWKLSTVTGELETVSRMTSLTKGNLS